MTTAPSPSIEPVTAGALTKSLALLTKLTRQRMLPILRGCKITVAGGITTLECFDYELTAHLELTGHLTDVIGVYLVDAIDLHAFVRSLAKSTPLVAAATSTHLELHADGATCRLELLDLEEYPALPDPVPARALADRAELTTLIGRVATAAGTDDTLPVLTGISLVFDGDTLTAAATNRYLLAVAETKAVRLVDVPRDPVSVLVPATTLHLAMAMHALSDVTTVRIGVGDIAGSPMVTLACGTGWLTARTLDGTFPKWQSLFPEDPATLSLTLDRKLTIRTVDQVLAAAGWKSTARLSPSLRVEVWPDRLELAAMSTDNVARASATLPAITDGELGTFALDPRYLRAIATAYAPAETITLSLVHPHKPLVLTATEASGVRFLLMPIKLAG